MKVPFSGNNQSLINSKPGVTDTAATATSTTSPYEPISVLEVCPSPVGKKAVSTNTTSNTSRNCEDPLQLEDHVLNHQLEDWDSWMRELGLDNDSIPAALKPISQQGTTHSAQDFSSVPELITPVSYLDSLTRFEPLEFSLLSDIITTNTNTPLGHINKTIQPFDQLSGDIQNLNNNYLDVGFDYVDELIRLAECFETNSLQLGQVSLARLNQQLRSPTGKPLQRAAFYFKEALQSLLSGSARQPRAASSSEIIQTIKAQKTFSSISPIPLFSSFTANQAVLEALEGSIHAHIIDFDIGLGSHWASFLKELAEKAESGKATPLLRITAIVPEEYAMESKLIKENLAQFAQELKIRLDVEFVSMSTFEYLSFKSIKFMDGENVVLLLSPAIFRHVGIRFLNDLHRVSPLVVVHVEDEGQMGLEAQSYRQAVTDGLEYYSTLFESLDAASLNRSACGGSAEWLRRVETSVFLPQILRAVQAGGRGRPPWREALLAAGLRQVGLGEFADFQAECLVRRTKVRGFHVAKQHEELLLCWQSRPLVSTSAWRY